MGIVRKKISGGIFAPKGFRGVALSCGIKDGKPTRLDVALVAADKLCSAAGTFTTNKVKAAPVKVSMERVASGRARAILLNSGNANACSGPEGITAAKASTAVAAKLLGCATEDVLVCSTGRIGVALPLERIEKGLSAIKELSRSAGEDCARAIMTSDTYHKQASCEITTPEGKFRIGAMAKGAGMIDPTMATMLCVFTTDARIAPSILQKTLREVVKETFNCISVDGDMSTNDTVLALASGESGIAPGAAILKEAMVGILGEMARMIVLDGEGVSRLVEVRVNGAASPADAKRAAEAVANSTLTKCAWFGGDPNWGRILCALGYSGAKLAEEKISLDYNGLPAVRCGVLAPQADWKKIKAVVAKKQFRVEISLGLGSHSYEAWTTDLTPEYVDFNKGE